MLASRLLLVGTRDSVLRGQEALNVSLSGYRRKPDLPFKESLNATLWATSDPWRTFKAQIVEQLFDEIVKCFYANCISTIRPTTAQDQQCHIVVRGRAWLGQFVAWSHPMFQPWDVQVWKAVPLPKKSHNIGDNVLVCTRNGAGACAIRDADYDGDTFMVSIHEAFLEFMNLMPEGRDIPEFVQAVKRVRQQVDGARKRAVHPISRFQEFALRTNTAPVRGVACMLPAVLTSQNPAQDGPFVRAVELGERAHCANDCPKKCDPETVINFSIPLGISATKSKSTCSL